MKEEKTYEEIIREETIIKIKRQNRELEKRIKLESALTILTYLMIIVIIAAVICKLLIVLGIASIANA